MDMKYMSTIEKIVAKNKNEHKSFITIYRSKKHLEESFQGLFMFHSELQRFHDRWDVIICVGDGKGTTLLFHEFESDSAWEKFKEFAQSEKEPVGVSDKPKSSICQDNDLVMRNYYHKSETIKGWDNF